MRILPHRVRCPGERELGAAAALNHPCICTVYQVGEADGQTFIAMEPVEGTTLSSRLAAGTLPPDLVVRRL